MIRHWFSDVGAFRRDPLTLLSSVHQDNFAPVVRLGLGPAPVTFINDPALIKPLMKLGEASVDKGALVHKIGKVVGDSSLTLSGEAHRKRREILHERLSRGVANSYVPEMQATIVRVLAQLAKQGRFRADIIGGTLALKLASVALFGNRVLSEADELAIMQAFITLEADLQAEMFRFLPRTPWKKISDDNRRRQALRVMEIVINKVTSAASSSSVLLALREAGLSEKEIRDEITTLVIAGFHTTGAAVAWICNYLSKRPREVEKIREEYQSIADSSGDIVPARLQDAKHSLAFVKEVLRLHPSAWWFSRETKQDATVGDLTIRAGTTMIMSPWVYQRSAKHYSNPLDFDSGRSFTGASYMPFGVGARACVGMGVAMLELQLIVLEIASAFELVQLNDASAVRMQPGITLNAPPMEFEIMPRGIRRGDFVRAA